MQIASEAASSPEPASNASTSSLELPRASPTPAMYNMLLLVMSLGGRMYGSGSVALILSPSSGPPLDAIAPKAHHETRMRHCVWRLDHHIPKSRWHLLQGRGWSEWKAPHQNESGSKLSPRLAWPPQRGKSGEAHYTLGSLLAGPPCMCHGNSGTFAAVSSALCWGVRDACCHCVSTPPGGVRSLTQEIVMPESPLDAHRIFYRAKDVLFQDPGHACLQLRP
jgi:hypothetical protein